MAGKEPFELLRADIEAHIKRRVSEAVGSLLQRVTALRGVAKALESAGDVTTAADPERLAEAAAGIRALATEAVTSATGCIGISERLRAYASVGDLVAVVSEAEKKELSRVVDGLAEPVSKVAGVIAKK